MTPLRRRIALAAATLTLAGLTTACGAIGNAVDCNQVAQEVNKITAEFTSSMTTSATDAKAIEAASHKTAGELKDLAGKYDGDLAGALTDMAAIFDGIKAADPTSTADTMAKLPAATAKFQSACGG
jgi:hypothetical protein